jgi:hypothetical protein
MNVVMSVSASVFGQAHSTLRYDVEEYCSNPEQLRALSREGSS